MSKQLQRRNAKWYAFGCSSILANMKECQITKWWMSYRHHQNAHCVLFRWLRESQMWSMHHAITGIEHETCPPEEKFHTNWTTEHCHGIWRAYLCLNGNRHCGGSVQDWSGMTAVTVTAGTISRRSWSGKVTENTADNGYQHLRGLTRGPLKRWWSGKGATG